MTDTITAPEQTYTENATDSFASALDAAFAGLNNVKTVDGVELDFEEPDTPTPADAGTDNVPEQETYDSEETAPEEVEEVEGSEDASAETENADTDDAFSDWTPKAANRFKQLKAELKEYKAETERLRQLTAEYDAKVAELDALAAKNDPGPLEEKLREYEQDLMFRDLEATDIYKRTVEEPITQIMEGMARIAEENEIDVDALIDVLALDDPKERKSQLSSLLVGVPEQDKIEVYMAARDLDPLMARRDNLFANVQEALNEARMIDESQQKEILAQRAVERQEIAGAVVNKVKEKLPFLKVAEGVDFGAIEKKAADLDPTVADPVDIAFGAVASQLVPVLVREYAIMRKEVEALTDKLAEYDSAEPSLSGRTRDTVSGSRPDMSFEDAISAALGSL